MSDRRIRVVLDKNDDDWTSQRSYICRLAAAFRAHERVDLVESVEDADVIHLNYLNPLGRIVHGKESRWRHIRDIATAFSGIEGSVVVTAHGVEEFGDAGESMYVESYTPLQQLAHVAKRGASRLFATHVDGIVAISSMDRESLITAGFDPETVYHVPHGVGDEFLTAPTREESGFVLHVSKYSPHKNPQAIIKASERLQTDVKIVGGGWRENYGVEFDKISNAELLGYVSEEKLIDLYSRASVFYFPSTYEPFGLPILEAMACGTPVIASVNSAAPDIRGEGITAIDPYDVDSHVSEIRRLLSDDELRASQGRKAEERAGSFTWEQTAESTIAIYEELTE
jgi:glycosyltransferase involved in cell wall biosynthesis